jgi:Flp pilus assembly protein TadG
VTCRRNQLPRGDDGTILLLVLGFAAVLLVLVAVVVDVSAVILAKRGAASAADGAAIAAAQQLDQSAVYANGLDGAIPLSTDDVQRVVGTYAERAAQSQHGLQLTAVVDGAGKTATVTAVRELGLPFGGWLGVGSVTVTAVAHARAPLVAP